MIQYATFLVDRSLIVVSMLQCIIASDGQRDGELAFLLIPVQAMQT